MKSRCHLEPKGPTSRVRTRNCRPAQASLYSFPPSNIRHPMRTAIEHSSLKPTIISLEAKEEGLYDGSIAHRCPTKFRQTYLGPVVPVDFHVFLRVVSERKHSRQSGNGTHVAEITSPVLCAPGSKAEVYADFQVFLRNNLGRTRFVDLLRLAVDEKRERRGAVSRNEGHVHTLRVEGLRERYRAGGGKNTSPAATISTT